MPNWCNNTVTITHTDPAKLEALAEAVREGKFCAFVKPVPDSLNIVAGSVGAKGSPEQLALEAQEQENLAQHGYKTWYDFCVNEWGTKWDVDSYEAENTLVDGGVLQFGFDSAWSPPIAIYEALIEQGYEVVAYYYEPGMAYVGKWDNGDDECIEYGSESSKTVRDAIGEELDDMFGISESMAEFEDDEEEVTEWYEKGCESRGLTPGESK